MTLRKPQTHPQTHLQTFALSHTSINTQTHALSTPDTHADLQTLTQTEVGIETFDNLRNSPLFVYHLILSR